MRPALEGEPRGERNEHAIVGREPRRALGVLRHDDRAGESASAGTGAGVATGASSARAGAAAPIAQASRSAAVAAGGRCRRRVAAAGATRATPEEQPPDDEHQTEQREGVGERDREGRGAERADRASRRTRGPRRRSNDSRAARSRPPRGRPRTTADQRNQIGAPTTLAGSEFELDRAAAADAARDDAIGREEDRHVERELALAGCARRGRRASPRRRPSVLRPDFARRPAKRRVRLDAPGSQGRSGGAEAGRAVAATAQPRTPPAGAGEVRVRGRPLASRAATPSARLPAVGRTGRGVASLRRPRPTALAESRRRSRPCTPPRRPAKTRHRPAPTRARRRLRRRTRSTASARSRCDVPLREQVSADGRRSRVRARRPPRASCGAPRGRETSAPRCAPGAPSAPGRRVSYVRATTTRERAATPGAATGEAVDGTVISSEPSGRTSGLTGVPSTTAPTSVLDFGSTTSTNWRSMLKSVTSARVRRMPSRETAVAIETSVAIAPSTAAPPCFVHRHLDAVSNRREPQHLEDARAGRSPPRPGLPSRRAHGRRARRRAPGASPRAPRCAGSRAGAPTRSSGARAASRTSDAIDQSSRSRSRNQMRTSRRASPSRAGRGRSASGRSPQPRRRAVDRPRASSPRAGTASGRRPGPPPTTAGRGRAVARRPAGCGRPPAPSGRRVGRPDGRR